MKNLIEYLVEHHGLDKDADEAAAKKLAAELLKSGDLEPDKYADLLGATQKETTQQSPQEALESMLDENARKTATAVADALSPAFTQIAEALKSRGEAEADDDDPPPLTPEQESKALEAMENRLMEKFQNLSGGDGADLMDMAFKSFKSEDDPHFIRVKNIVERFEDTKTAMVYRSDTAKLLKIKDHPVTIAHSPLDGPSSDRKEINQPTPRTRFMCEVLAKAQVLPERLTDDEWSVLKWIAHKQPFHVPNSTQARHLTERERDEWLDGLKNFYVKQEQLLDETAASGGAAAVPEFFDFDMIVAPTLADENLAAFCNIVPVARGSSARNFVLGRPTVDSWIEGSSETIFDADGFVTPHNTDFHREGGVMEIGRNFLQDAHPGLAAEIRAQYGRSARLRMHRNIVKGNGSTEMLGIFNTPLVTDVPSSAGTAGPPTINDILNLMFAVKKPFRFDGGRMNAVFIGTEASYKRTRQIATGVTGDTRLVFGMNVEDYMLFDHPWVIEEDGLADHEVAFMQAKGYRIYLRQGVRFFREDRGAELVKKNTLLVGIDMRTGGQLDLSGYAAVIDDFDNPLP